MSQVNAEGDVSPPTGSRRGLLGSSAIVAVGTGLSRVTGLARTIVIAAVLGTTLLGDTFNLANTTPNIFYDLILGGILAATLVPIMVERFDRGDTKAIDALATVITACLVVLTILAVLASPLLIKLYTLGLDDAEASEQASVAVPLLMLFMPQVLFYGLTALWTAILHARRSFAAPAFAPVLNNVVVICLFLGLARIAGGDLTFEGVSDDKALLVLLGLGTTAGIVAMTAVLWPALRRAGIRLRWNPDWRNPALRTVARLSGWTFGYVAANQAVFVVVLALLNEQGAVAAYSYAWQFFQLPVGLFAVSVMTTFTPELALHAGRWDLDAYRMRFSQGLRLGTLVVLPTAACLLVLATPLVTVLLEWAEFDAASTASTAPLLTWLALGLPGFAVFLFTMRGFYAFKDTRTPFFLNLFENGLQIALSFALVVPFGAEGVMAAFSVSYLAAGLAGLAMLHRRAEGLGNIAPGLARQGIAALAAAVVMLAFNHLYEAGDRMGSLVELVGGVVIGLGTYVVALAVLRGDEGSLLRSLRQREPAG